MNIFEKRKTLIAYLFLRLWPAKNEVGYICKNSHFRLPFQKDYGKRVSTLFKFEQQHMYHIYWSTGRQLSSKRSVLVICKSLRLFVNTVSAVDKCFLPNRDNLMTPIHLNLSQKVQTFSEFFSAFSKCWLNLEHLQKKDDDHTLFISEATACEKCA